jgi:hypothetical protein
MSMATLASFPFLYVRAKSIRSEAPESALPATDSPAFPGNRIPLLTRPTKLFVVFGALVVAASFYLRAMGTSPEKWRSTDQLLHSSDLGKVNAVRGLLAAGVEVNAQIRPWTPLTRATLFGQSEVVDVLLQAGADVNFEDDAVGSPVYLATVARRNDILTKLLERGADPDNAPSWGLTPLMVAAMQGNEEAVRLLLKHGADKSRRSKDGRLASDLAKEEGQFAIAELLK